ncbi:TIGR02678 family protein [Natronospora cellulosivora (SeqCode)]
MKELEILLERYWISKEEDKELYYRIKDAYPKLKTFLQDRLGYRLIINPYLIKLEKLPGKPESWMGIEEFTDKLEYAFLTLLLTFLEDKGAEEQFILSQLTDFIEAIFPQDRDIELDWTLYNHRRHLVKVLRFAEDIFLIKTNDGSDSNFISSAEEEVLYENTGLSKYFMLNFAGNISNYSSYKDIEKGEWLDLDRDRGRVRRNRVYRRLFMSPVVYNEGVDDADYLYIKNYRNMLKKDVEDLLESELHVHKNGAFISLDESKYFKDVFPDNKSISDIVLQMNAIIREMLEEGDLSKKEDDTITISEVKFANIVVLCHQRYHSGWSKGYREMSIEKLVEELIVYMKSFSMLEADNSRKEIRILPLVGKIIGKYPDDFKIEGGE